MLGEMMIEIESRERKRPSTENLLAVSQRPVFPFLILRLEKTRAGATPPTILRLKIREELYNYFTKIFGTDELMLYHDPQNGKVELWTPSMHLSFEAMEELGLMSSKTTWVQKARPMLKKTLSKIPQE